MLCLPSIFSLSAAQMAGANMQVAWSGARKSGKHDRYETDAVQCEYLPTYMNHIQVRCIQAERRP